MIYNTWYSSWKFNNDLEYERFKKKVNERVRKNYVLKGVGKMKIKTYFVIFSNARLILELMLCNQSLEKLVYQTLFSSDCRAQALPVFEKSTKFSIKIGQKRTLIMQLNRTINQCKFLTWGKKHFFVLLYNINNLSVVLEIMIS